mmetsp:Transcript_14345/g.39621  ORF Transcript_14345/g.39621 Transcript_14345/m.39621 type:complete len:529 (+) Transcript_14345:96-1682(+)
MLSGASTPRTAATVRTCLALLVVAGTGLRIDPPENDELAHPQSQQHRSGLSTVGWSVLQNWMHHQVFAQKGFSEEAPNSFARKLATVRASPSVSLNSSVAVQFESIIPVFGESESYMAFLIKWDEAAWMVARSWNIYCVTADGKHRSKVTPWGGETDAAYKSFMAWHCEWPRDEREKTCHSVRLVKGVAGSITDEHIGTFEACHNATLSSEASYNLVACVPLTWESASDVESSGIVQLPQWLEYGVMHGVDQFVLYTMPDTDPRVYEIMEPYFQRGLATQVLLEASGTSYRASSYAAQQIIGNDCLYRMKHRAAWLMPFVDADEYIHFNSTANRGFPSVMSELVASQTSDVGAVAHGLSFGRYTFQKPNASLHELQLSSTLRETKVAPLCPKYVVRPHLVHALFVHWPTSWAVDTKMLGMPSGDLVGFHYRKPMDRQHRSPCCVQDASMLPEVPLLALALHARHGSPWPAFVASLEQPRPGALVLQETAVVMDHALRVADEFHNFVRSFNSFSVPTFFDPPGSGARAY